MGGFLNTPTPGGVPVRNTSPGVNVTNLAGEKTRQKANTQKQNRACAAEEHQNHHDHILSVGKQTTSVTVMQDTVNAPLE